jgi:hypothetical protein
MSEYEIVSASLYAVQSLVLIVVLVVYAKQLSQMRQQVAAARHASEAQNLLALAGFLQAEDVRGARGVVIRQLEGRDHNTWSEDENRAAAKVCSSYGTAGVVLEAGTVPEAPFLDNWGPSIRRCHTILGAFIVDRRKQMHPTYWAVFDRLAKRASDRLTRAV